MQTLLTKDLSITPVTENNINVLINLSQHYEAEFSPLTAKMPDENGIFKLDTMPTSPYTGYILYKNNIPIGFSVINIRIIPHEIMEFYIIPVARGTGFGEIFAHYIFAKHPGSWQVKQISGANLAIKFWRKTISSFTNKHFVEEILDDPIWGMVTQQSFISQ